MPEPLSVQMSGSEWCATRAGGLNRYFEDLVTALRTAGAHVDAAAFGKSPEGEYTWGSEGPLVSRLARTLRRPVLAADSFDTHIVDTHFALYSGWALRVRRTTEVPHVVHFQGPWAGESAVAGSRPVEVAVKQAVENLSYGGADAVIVASAAFGNLLTSKYRVSPDVVHVIPPGIDLKRFRWRPGGQVVEGRVVCARRLERRMGIHLLVEGWRDVLRQHPRASLRIIGDGSERGALEEQVRSLGLQDSIRLLGHLPDELLAAEYQSAQSTVVPSISLEGFGLIAVESLASGVPVIVTRCGGLPSTVTGLDESLIVEAGDAQALGARLAEALDGRVPPPEACRAWAETFSWARAAQSHLDLYRRLVS